MIRLLPAGPASEKHDPLQFLVVQEIIEAPQAAVFAERIRTQVRIVRIYVAIIQRYFVVDGGPQGRS